MRFPVIVADPPWDFTTYSDKAQKSAKQHYRTMSLFDIANLPVSDVAADVCCLLLWATWPNLEDALTVGAAWGFSYKTCAFNWIKRSGNGTSWHTGLGYYTRSNSEPCLLFTRGGTPQRQHKDVHQVLVSDDAVQPLPGFEEVLTSPVAAHSEKPGDFYFRVERLLQGPYLELFSRRYRPGWVTLGNELDGLDIADSLKRVATDQPLPILKENYHAVIESQSLREGRRHGE